MTSAKYHPSDEVLSDFAQGKLSTGMSVALSAHIELCQSCRQRSSELESREIVSWLQADRAQPLASPDFSGLLDLITSQPQLTIETKETPHSEEEPLVSELHMLDHSITLPRVLAKAASRGLVWHKLAGGINQAQVQIDNETQCEFLYMTPGSQVPVHRHQGSEVTLVLDGGFEDEFGHYGPSDFLVRDKRDQHQPSTEEGCLCFAVLDSPLTFTSGLARLFNPINNYRFRRATSQRF